MSLLNLVNHMPCAEQHMCVFLLLLWACRKPRKLRPPPYWYAPSGEEEAVAKGRTSDAVDGTRVAVVGLEVLLVVADGTLVDQPVLGAGKVRRPVAGREVERQTAGLPRNHTLRVSCNKMEYAQPLVMVWSVHAFTRMLGDLAGMI